MMKTGFLVVALAGLLGSGAVRAATGTELLSHCQEAIRALDGGNMTHEEMYHSGICLGITEAVVMMVQYYGNTKLPDDYKICLPNSGISVSQATRIVIKYLKDNPELLHMDATYLEARALFKAFPCK